MKDKIGDPIRAQRSGSDGERSDSGAYELCASGQSEGCARGSDDDAEEVLVD